VLAFFPGCRNEEETEGVVAWVNDESIPFSEFWDEFKSRYTEVADPSSPQKDIMQSLKQGVMSDLIRERLLLQEAAKRDLAVSEEELDKRMEDLKEGYTGGEFRKSLMVHGRGYELCMRRFRKNLVIEKLFREVVKGAGEVTEEEARTYYEENSDAFLLPETVDLKQIVVKDRSLARSIRKRLKKGEAFSALASEYSIAPEKAQGGDLGIFRKGELPEELEKEAFSTPVGKVSSMIQTRYGYHLLKVCKKTSTHTAPFEEARDMIVRKLLSEKQEAYYRQWVESRVRGADIRVNETLKEVVLDRNIIQPLHTPGELHHEPEKERP